MGRNPTGQRRYQLQQVWALHHEIIRRLVLGQKSKDIAAELGVTEATVSYTKNSAIVQRQLSIMSGAKDAAVIDATIEVRKRLGKALEVLDDTLENEAQPHLRFAAAKEVLDREAPKISRFEGITARLTPEQITELKNRAIEVARESGMLAESEYRQVSGPSRTTPLMAETGRAPIGALGALGTGNTSVPMLITPTESSCAT